MGTDEILAHLDSALKEMADNLAVRMDSFILDAFREAAQMKVLVIEGESEAQFLLRDDPNDPLNPPEALDLRLGPYQVFAKHGNTYWVREVE